MLTDVLIRTILYLDDRRITGEGEERMNDVWSALSDATRREILTMLRDGDMTAG